MKKLLVTVFAICVAGLITVSAQSTDSSGKVYWRGTVDNKVHLVIRGDSFEVRTVEGSESGPGNHSFTTPLPSEAVTVSVSKQEGRSKRIAVIQQPTDENSYTAIVEVHDDGGGAREYHLEISWR